MGNMKIERKFPCGYENKVEVTFSFLDMGFAEMKDMTDDTCPLHGKDCKRS